MQIFKATNLFNKIKNSIKYFFITISILLFCFVIFNLEGIDGNFNNFFDVINAIGSVIISIGLLKIGIEANKIAKEQKTSNDLKISDSEKRIVKDYHEKLSLLTAKSYNYWFGRNFNKDSQGKEDPNFQILGLYISSKVDLPDELSLLIKEMYQFYTNVATIFIDASEKNISLGNKLAEMYESESKLRLKVENLFSKYLKIPTKKL